MNNRIWIVTSDKHEIYSADYEIKLDKEILTDETMSYIYWHVIADEKIVGTYNTLLRAEEIMNEIIQCIKNHISIYTMPNE